MLIMLTRLVSRLLVILVVLTAFGVGVRHPAQACSCVEASLPELVQDPQLTVLVGKVIDGPNAVARYDDAAQRDLTYYEWELEVTQSYGQEIASSLRIYTETDSAACGFDSLPTEPIGFVTYERFGGELWTGVCQGLWSPAAMDAAVAQRERNGLANQSTTTLPGLGGLSAPAMSPPATSASDDGGTDGAPVAGSNGDAEGVAGVTESKAGSSFLWWFVPILLIGIGLFVRYRHGKRPAADEAGAAVIGIATGAETMVGGSDDTEVLDMSDGLDLEEE